VLSEAGRARDRVEPRLPDFGKSLARDLGFNFKFPETAPGMVGRVGTGFVAVLSVSLVMASDSRDDRTLHRVGSTWRRLVALSPDF
jgi:hypothetical protein